MSSNFINYVENLYAMLSSEYNYTNPKNTTKCDDGINHYLFYQVTLAPAVLIFLSFALMRKRRNILLNILNGRPGLVCPMDAMTQSSHISYACAFGVTIFLVYQIVIEQQFAIEYDGPVGLKTLIAVVSMVIYGLVFFPIFACLAIGSVFGYGLGALYVWAITAINIYKIFACDVSMTTQLLIVFRGFPLLGCLVYLSLSIPGRFIMAARKKTFFVVAESDLDYKQDLETIRNSYQGLHVIKLLQKPEGKPRPSQGIFGKIKDLIKSFLKKTLYHWEKDFRYPSRILSILTVGVFLLYVMMFESLSLFIPLFEILEYAFLMALENLSAEEAESVAIANSKQVLNIVYMSVFSLKVCVIVSLALACALALLMIIYTLSSYRSNLKALYRGDHSAIPNIDSRSNSAHMVGFIRYAGYQVGYITWGFVIQAVVFFIITVAISAVVILVHSGIKDWLVRIVSNLWPALLLTIVLNILQLLLSRFFFLQNKGERLRLDNRRMLFTFTYFMFFFNIFLGLVSCLLRIFKSIIVGAIFLPRLDVSSMPHRFQFFDPGFAAYVGYLHVENAHTHPVMFVFIRLMKMNLNKEYQHSSTVAMEMNTKHNSVMPNTIEQLVNGKADTERGLRVKEKWRKRYAARFMWYLAYTLINNAQVRFYRKGYLQMVKKARQEGITLPVSDKLIVDVTEIHRKMQNIQYIIVESTHM